MLEFELSARGPSPRLPIGDLLLDPTGGLPSPRLFCFTPPNFNSWIRPWTWCRVFHSRVFHPCQLMPRFPLLRFPPLLLGAAFSTPAFSTPAILMVPHFPLPRFQSTRTVNSGASEDRSDLVGGRSFSRSASFLNGFVLKKIDWIYDITKLLNGFEMKA